MSPPSIRDAHLRAIVAAAEDWPGLLATARQSAAVVCALADTVPPVVEERPFPLFLQSGDTVVFDGSTTLSKLLIDGLPHYHLSGHTAQIQALRAT